MTFIDYSYEPLEHRPEPRSRRDSQFKASYDETLRLLDYEINFLGAKAAVIQMDVDRSDLRADGMLRAHAKPRSPAVVLSFSCRHGDLSYPCDNFADWKHNLRAIALALEALRKIDRYGVTKRGEQYTGWASLMPPVVDHEFGSRTNALEFLELLLGVGSIEGMEIETILQNAEKKTHPDKPGGDADLFKRVQAARKILVGV